MEKEEEYYEVHYEESVSFTSKEGNEDATIPTPWETSGECLRVAKESFVKLPLTMKEKLLDEQLICKKNVQVINHYLRNSQINLYMNIYKVSKTCISMERTI